MTTRHARSIVNPVIQDTVTFLELSAETGGAYTLARIELAPGGRNERHYHRAFDETFTCVEGRLGVQVGAETVTLAPSQSITAKAGEVHRFFNASPDEPVTFTVRVAPGSPGFERMLQVLYGLAADGLTDRKGVPRSLWQTALIVAWGDTNMPGVLSLIEPLLRWMARRAERDGRAHELIARYCRY